MNRTRILLVARLFPVLLLPHRLRGQLASRPPRRMPRRNGPTCRITISAAPTSSPISSTPCAPPPRRSATCCREVTEARASATRITVTPEQLTDPAAMARFAQAQSQLTLSLQRLQEAYPELHTNANFPTLMSQLEGTENRISIARRDYNAAVQAYNTDDPHLPVGDRRRGSSTAASRWCPIRRTRPPSARRRSISATASKRRQRGEDRLRRWRRSAAARGLAVAAIARPRPDVAAANQVAPARGCGRHGTAIARAHGRPAASRAYRARRSMEPNLLTPAAEAALERAIWRRSKRRTTDQLVVVTVAIARWADRSIIMACDSAITGVSARRGE